MSYQHDLGATTAESIHNPAVGDDEDKTTVMEIVNDSAEDHWALSPERVEALSTGESGSTP